MKNQLYVCVLLFILATLSCSESEFRYNKNIYLSDPAITRTAASDGDSLIVKGFSRCEALDVYKGTLPENVAKESGYDKSYLYYIYEVSVELEDNSSSLIISVEDTTLGYSSGELTDRGYFQSTVKKDGGNTYLKIYTYFIHLFKEVNGNNLDIWYPCDPFDMEWRFSAPYTVAD